VWTGYILDTKISKRVAFKEEEIEEERSVNLGNKTLLLIK
jgi:hypothetical protein